MIKKFALTPLIRISILLICFLIFVFYSSYSKPIGNKKLGNNKESSAQELQQAVIKSEVVEKPIVKPVNLPIDVSAKSAMVSDIDGNLFYSKNLNAKLAPASTTKIMTAVVALEEYNLDDVVEVPYYCTTVPTQKVGFVVGEKLTIRALITSMLVFSGADAACTLQFKNSEPHIFVNKMNEKAQKLGMDNTNFSNVIGYDELDHYSSAMDMYKLSIYAMTNKEFARNVSLKEVVIVSVDGANVHNIKNTNELLFTHPNVIGIKTGFTDFAKDCLVFEYELQGKRFLGVVLGSDSRFEDAEKMITATNDYLTTLLSSAGK